MKFLKNIFKINQLIKDIKILENKIIEIKQLHEEEIKKLIDTSCKKCGKIIISNKDIELEATDCGFNIKKFSTNFKWEQYDFTLEELEELYLQHKKLIKK